MRLFSVSFLLLIFSPIVIPPVAYGDFSGQVLDSYLGNPVQYVTVYAPSIKQSTSTDENGHFNIQVDIDDQSIQMNFHRLGYLATSIVVEKNKKVIVEMEPKAVGLDVVTLKNNSLNSQLLHPFNGDRLIEGLPGDVADVFANTPGFGVVRKGAYGADPVIRGFKREQLLVQVDGVGMMECACPNRMDPITAQIQPEDLEEIQVINGPYTLRYGAAIGGMINIKYDRPQPGETEKSVHIAASSRYESNGSGNITRLAFEKVGSKAGIKITGGRKTFSDYKDGEGRKIPSEYDVIEYSLLGSYQPVANQLIDLLFRQSFANDIAYAGLPMDAVKDDATLGQLVWKYSPVRHYINSIEFSVYASYVDHVMDNHQRPNFAFVDAVAATNTNTWGGRAEVMLTGLSHGVLFAGLDTDIISKRGSRKRVISMNPCNGQVVDPPAIKTDAIWQDAEFYTSGFFAEWQQKAGNNSRIVSSVRLDLYTADAGDPSTQFLTEYGNKSKNASHALSYTASYEMRPIENGELLFSLGHSSRFPSITELYINHLSVGQDGYEYFGNPNLKPEGNTQIDLSFGVESSLVQTQVSGFYAYLTDAIYAEVDTTLPRLFLPCMDPEFTKRFTNIEKAGKWGIEWYSSASLSKHFDLNLSLAYTWAQDFTRDEPLPETPPFEASWNLKYRAYFLNNSWLMIQGRHVSEQNRNSELYGELPSESFHVFHYRMGMMVSRNAELILGVRNIFNETYYEHLNRNFKNQTSVSQLYEPGRNFYVQIKINL